MLFRIKHIVSVLLLLLSCALSGQNTISLHYTNSRMRDVLDEIEVQSGLTFSYSSRLLDDSEIIDVDIEKLRLEQVLQNIFAGRKIKFILLEEQIVLKKDRSVFKEPLQDSVSIPLPEVIRRYTVSGYARDVVTGEVLIGATVTVSDKSVGAITNSFGFYSLTLESVYDSLFCSYIGYETKSFGLSGKEQVLDILLKEHLQSIQEVVIYSDERMETIRTARTSEQRIQTSSVRKMPALFGEKDVIKSLAAIPGVKFFGDGSTIFYVRGGSRDQNLVTIDDAPVYNPSHLLGFFSTIVPDAVKDIQVYKGDFPASYGGRLSSLIDIRTKDGNMQDFGMDASFGLLSSRLSLEGPLWKDHISYFISGRRSYFLKSLQKNAMNLNDLHFADLHFKINYRINKKNRVYFSFYNSNDNYEAWDGGRNLTGINWKNSTSTIRWNHLFNDRLFSNTTMYASGYDYFLKTDIQKGNYWNSHIDVFSLKSDFTYYISSANTIRFGVRTAQHFMNPGNYYQSNQLLPLPYEISTKSVNESNLYFSDHVILSDNLSLRMGLRFTAWNNIGPASEYSISEGELITDTYGAGQVYNTYFTADPRLGLAYKASNEAMFKISYGRTSQFEHLITNSISPFSTLEVWLPSGPRIKPQRADQFTLGYTRKLGRSGFLFESELYYKYLRNQVDYRDHAKLLMNPFVEYELRFGSGEAYGLETMLSKKKGRLNGWVSYTLSRSMLTIESINNDEPFPSYGDRPHDFSLFLSYLIGPRLELSGSFIYMTGAPFTAPTAFYYYENYQVPIYFKRNNDRLPDYHRLDVALNWNLRKKEARFKHELIFSIYNLYGRKNPVAIHFNKIENDNGQLVVPYNYYSAPELTPSQYFIYRIVPSVSYHFSF